MKRTRHTPEQIIGKLREADGMLATGWVIGDNVRSYVHMEPLTEK
jgi:hypothetical protein